MFALRRTIEESPPPLPPKKRNLSSNVTSTMPTVPASLSLERLSLKSDNSSIASFDSSHGGGSAVKVDSTNEESATTAFPSSLVKGNKNLFQPFLYIFACSSFDILGSTVTVGRENTSSSSSGFISLRNSSHCFTEQQQQQHQRCVLTSSSSVDGTLMTAIYSEARSLTTTNVTSTFTTTTTTTTTPSSQLDEDVSFY